VAIYKVKLKQRREIAERTMAFYFEKPRGFSYKAGQFGDFTLINPPETDDEGNTRAFSLASAPFEDDLMIATRLRDSAMKRVLKSMPIGTEVKMDAPYGSLTLHSDGTIPAVFLCGGIGITPVRSIILQATRDHFPHTLLVVDSNRRPEDAPFINELMDAANNNPNLTVVGTMSGMDKSAQSWDGPTGHVTAELLTQSIAELGKPIYYVAGPQAMVLAMRAILDKAGVKDDKIRIEEFYGY
jgi:ferredoxin-NADP reductase